MRPCRGASDRSRIVKQSSLANTRLAQPSQLGRFYCNEKPVARRAWLVIYINADLVLLRLHDNGLWIATSLRD